MAESKIKMITKPDGDVTFQVINAQLMKKPYRNFAGRPSKIHPNGGVREFAILIEDPDEAQKLIEFGFNVKTYDYKGEDYNYLSIKVNYYTREGNPIEYPPRFKIFTANNWCFYEEQNIKELDTAYLVDVNLKFNPSYRDIGGKHYVTPYLRSFQAALIDDDFSFEDDDDEAMPFDV